MFPKGYERITTENGHKWVKIKTEYEKCSVVKKKEADSLKPFKKFVSIDVT